MATVLIVEDDLRLAKLCALVLRMDGHQTISVDSGPAALREMASSRPDVIVLDLDLPGAGLNLLREIQTMFNRPPVLMLAASGARTAQERLGAEASLAKPFDPEKLSRL